MLVVGGDNGFAFLDDAHVLELSGARAKGRAKLEREALERAVAHGAHSETCVVCLDGRTDTIFLWCAHFVCCAACAAQIKECPYCRKPIYRAERLQF